MFCSSHVAPFGLAEHAKCFRKLDNVTGVLVFHGVCWKTVVFGE